MKIYSYWFIKNATILPKILFSLDTIFITHWLLIIDSRKTKFPSAKTSSFSPTALEILNSHQPATEKTTDLVDRFASQIFA